MGGGVKGIIVKKERILWSDPNCWILTAIPVRVICVLSTSSHVVSRAVTFLYLFSMF